MIERLRARTCICCARPFDELEKFFEATDALESKKLEFLGWRGPTKAIKTIKKGCKYGDCGVPKTHVACHLGEKRVRGEAKLIAIASKLLQPMHNFKAVEARLDVALENRGSI